MRYELVRVAQLVFTLAVMFGAFSAGLAAGWLHWGRAQRKDSAGPQSLEDVPRIVKPDLFSPAVVPAWVRPSGVKTRSRMARLMEVPVTASMTRPSTSVDWLYSQVVPG